MGIGYHSTANIRPPTNAVEESEAQFVVPVYDVASHVGTYSKVDNRQTYYNTEYGVVSNCTLHTYMLYIYCTFVIHTYTVILKVKLTSCNNNVVWCTRRLLLMRKVLTGNLGTQ